MPVLKVWQNESFREIIFSGTPVVRTLLQQHLIRSSHPCGGRGICKKCAIRAEGHLTPLTEAEKSAGTRLSCQTALLGDAVIWLPEDTGSIQLSGTEAVLGHAMDGGQGAAIDIGTTTIALKRYDLHTGAVLAQAGIMNPQRTIAADVMGRIGAAMNGQADILRNMLADAIRSLLIQTGETLPDILVITGNTTMLYLLTGRHPACLSAAPFQADCLFDCHETFLGIPVYYPPCMNAFVGADITCAVLDSGMCRTKGTALLCDIGTNGEIALWTEGKLYVTSTAAGPAFEGAGISCGCGSIPGAIDRVWVENSSIHMHTIGEQKAAGLCGSGLVEAIAAFLETGHIDETGAVDEDFLFLTEDVKLLPADVRAVQLAKGAIAAGIRTLLEEANITEDQIETLYIAGGFGSHLNTVSAAAIGLIPAGLADRVTVLGNSALSGASRMLLDQSLVAAAKTISRQAVHVPLSGSSRFSRHFMNTMLFGEEELFD